MAVDSLILVANPGSASRKYALFAGNTPLAKLHFEYVGSAIVCTLQYKGRQVSVPVTIDSLHDTANHVVAILRNHALLTTNSQISKIGLRVVAPGRYFLHHRPITEDTVYKLTALRPRAPLHIDATLKEMQVLRTAFNGTPIIGLSDSAFHATKPERAWNYGLPLRDAEQLEIRRYGYHGLSVGSVVRTLKKAHKHAAKLVVCHLGSGASVTAVLNGKSIDTTMGYSPLEGLLMGTRSGSIDATVVHVLKTTLKMTDAQVDEYLNKQSGLLGLGGSADIRTLLHKAAEGEHRPKLALATYVYAVQKAIGQMAAALNGVDALVFTGTVGERSMPIRHHVAQNLDYLDIWLDERANSACDAPQIITSIGEHARSKPIYVVPSDEAGEIVNLLLSQ